MKYISKQGTPHTVETIDPKSEPARLIPYKTKADYVYTESDEVVVYWQTVKGKPVLRVKWKADFEAEYEPFKGKERDLLKTTFGSK